MDVVQYLHYNGNGEWTNDRVKEDVTEVEKKREELKETGYTEEEMPDESELYLQQVRREHGCIRGLGQIGQTHIVSGPSYSSRGTSFGSYSRADVEQVLVLECQRHDEEMRLTNERLERLECVHELQES